MQWNKSELAEIVVDKIIIMIMIYINHFYDHEQVNTS